MEGSIRDPSGRVAFELLHFAQDPLLQLLGGNLSHRLITALLKPQLRMT